MPKVLAKAGDSLADVYDIEGSIAGVDQLLSNDVNLFHEMGGVIFSERLELVITRKLTGAIAQNITWDILIEGLPLNAFKIQSVSVVADADRISNCVLSARSSIRDRESIIFSWDTGADPSIPIRHQAQGGAPAAAILLRSSVPFQSVLMAGSEQREALDQVAFRGLTTGFGAGTVEVTAFLHIARTGAGDISSRGLPVPSW